jgi:hypothetical protein
VLFGTLFPPTLMVYMSFMVDIGGYAGKTLRIDLSKGEVSEDVYDEEFLRKYLGGTAL